MQDLLRVIAQPLDGNQRSQGDAEDADGESEDHFIVEGDESAASGSDDEDDDESEGDESEADDEEAELGTGAEMRVFLCFCPFFKLSNNMLKSYSLSIALIRPISSSSKKLHCLTKGGIRG